MSFSFLVRVFWGIVTLTVFSLVITQLVSMEYASIAIGIVSGFVTLAISTSNPVQDTEPNQSPAQSTQSQHFVYIFACLIIAFAWIATITANNFLIQHFDMLLQNEIIALKHNSAYTMYQFGTASAVSIFVGFITTMLGSCILGAVAKTVRFVPLLLSSITTIFAFCTIRLALEWHSNQIQAETLINDLAPTLLGNTANSMKSSILLVLVFGVALGGSIAISTAMLISAKVGRILATYTRGRL